MVNPALACECSDFPVLQQSMPTCALIVSISRTPCHSAGLAVSPRLSLMALSETQTTSMLGAAFPGRLAVVDMELSPSDIVGGTVPAGEGPEGGRVHGLADGEPTASPLYAPCSCSGTACGLGICKVTEQLSRDPENRPFPSSMLSRVGPGWSLGISVVGVKS